MNASASGHQEQHRGGARGRGSPRKGREESVNLDTLYDAVKDLEDMMSEVRRKLNLNENVVQYKNKLNTENSASNSEDEEVALGKYVLQE